MFLSAPARHPSVASGGRIVTLEDRIEALQASVDALAGGTAEPSMMLTVKETAHHLRCSEWQVHRKIKAGVIPVTRNLVGHTRVPRLGLLAVIAAAVDDETPATGDAA